MAVRVRSGSANGTVITMTLDDFRRVVPPERVERLELKKQDELRLRNEREVVQERLNRLLQRISQLDKSVDEDDMTDAEFRNLEDLRITENLRHQQLAERLVRVGAQLSRNKRELKRMVGAVYKDFLANGMGRTTNSVPDQSRNQNSQS
ncbi:uncharacterized protein Dana_GF24060 [Drosophila ananassae]|uniref:Uncharacterized protein n=1 Tax=Drosophila ananassae TaxID=7217 RepID=B3MAF7_DROAN|nr:uncharacterized protein LOC6506695 [Drosophila ananassae]EDV40208.1 uncharacterized protein Dana_GF24060 [Drosophila ananassae]